MCGFYDLWCLQQQSNTKIQKFQLSTSQFYQNMGNLCFFFGPEWHPLQVGAFTTGCRIKSLGVFIFGRVLYLGFRFGGLGCDCVKGRLGPHFPLCLARRKMSWFEKGGVCRSGACTWESGRPPPCAMGSSMTVTRDWVSLEGRRGQPDQRGGGT